MFKKPFAEIKENNIQLLLLLVYTAIVVFFCSKMSPFYPIQEWSDVNLYYNIGKAIMHGQTLYTESFDHKGPLIFLLYGVGYLISNDSFLGLFFIQIVAWFVYVAASYFIAKLYLNKGYSFIVALFSLVLFISHTSQGGSAEEFITICMIVSLYLFVRYFRTPKEHNPTHMLIHGVLWSIVLFIKFNLVLFWVFPLLAIAIILIRRKAYKNLLVNILMFVVGAIAIALPILIYFVANGALQEAIDVYFVLNTSFRVDAGGSLVSKILISLYQRFRFEMIDFSIILLGAFIFPLLQVKNLVAKLSFPLAFLSLFTMAFMSGYVYYYSIPYYIFSVLGCVVIACFASKYLNIKTNWIVYALATLIAIGGSLYRKNFFDKFHTKTSASVIEEFTPIILQEEDRTLVNLALDDANALFTYANIVPNVKYFIAPNLPHAAYPQLRDEQTRYIQEGKTMFVVLAEHTNNALYFSQLQALQDNYEVVAKFEEFYAWHNTNRHYYLYKRKETK